MLSPFSRISDDSTTQSVLLHEYARTVSHPAFTMKPRSTSPAIANMLKNAVAQPLPATERGPELEEVVMSIALPASSRKIPAAEQARRCAWGTSGIAAGRDLIRKATPSRVAAGARRGGDFTPRRSGP